MNERSFILNNIEHFLSFELHPNNISRVLPLKPSSEWIQTCDNECKIAISNLKGLRYQLSADEFIRLLQLNYADTLSLIDCVRNYELTLRKSDPADEINGFYPALIASIQSVLMYMEGTGTNCPEPTCLLPEYEFQLQLEEIRQQSLVLRAKFRSKEIKLTLQQIVNDQLESFLQLKTCSYKQLSYTQKLLAGILGCLLQHKTDDWNMALARCLIIYNFNDAAFYEYMKLRLTALAEQEQHPGKQCSILRYYSKEIQTELPLSNLALHAEVEHIKMSILKFLEAELRFREDDLMKQSCPAEAEVQASARESASNLKLNSNKLKLNTNVRQLGIGVNILMQLKILVLEKSGIKGLLGFFVTNISTVGSENLSIDSLQKRVSEKNTAAALGLLKILEQMIVILRRDYLS
jgi:hypothetical protein